MAFIEGDWFDTKHDRVGFLVLRGVEREDGSVEDSGEDPQAKIYYTQQQLSTRSRFRNLRCE